MWLLSPDWTLPDPRPWLLPELVPGLTAPSDTLRLCLPYSEPQKNLRATHPTAPREKPFLPQRIGQFCLNTKAKSQTRSQGRRGPRKLLGCRPVRAQCPQDLLVITVELPPPAPLRHQRLPTLREGPCIQQKE